MNNLNNNAIPNFDEMTYEELLALEDKIGYVNRGFSKEKIDKIPFTVFVPSNNNNNSDNEKCVICQEMFTEGNKIKKLNCEHFYHQKCIDAWLSKEKNCPFCKIEVKIPE